MAIKSKRQRMLQDKRLLEKWPPKYDAYRSPKIMTFSTRFIVITCVALFLFVLSMFIPLQNPGLIFVRALVFTTTILLAVVMLYDRSIHLRS